MKSFVFVTLLITLGCFSATLFGQEDLSRDNRLPSKIGGKTCNNGAGSSATVIGSFNAQGLKPGKVPVFSVAVFAGGVFVSRQRLKNGASFAFYCVPSQNVTLVAEADSAEIATFAMGMLNSPPLSNRQDIIVTLPGGVPSDEKEKNHVISAQTAYERSKENQRLFDRATEELQKKKAERALEVLQELVETDPNDFVAWLMIGDIHFNEGGFAEAEKAYERTHSLKPDSTPAMLGLGRSALGTKNPARAIEILNLALSLKPDSADANHYLGEAYLQDRKGSLAIVHLNRAIDLDPNRKAELHLRLAALYHAAKAPNLAAIEYKKFLEKRPDHPDKQKIEKYILENSQ